jgi:hypothetical protein
MKVFKSGYVTAPTTESKVLVVATDETSSGGGHKVYFLNLAANGDINSTRPAFIPALIRSWISPLKKD